MAYLDPIIAASDALVAVLQDPSFVALCPGGVWDDVPENPTYPFLAFEVHHQVGLGGFGTRPGHGTVPQLRVRLHGYSQYTGFREINLLLAKAIELLCDAPPVVTGYSSWAIFHDPPVTELPGELIIGVFVNEVVADLRWVIEELAA